MTRTTFALAICSAFMAFCASAATFTVTNTADSGPGSLRQAIADADAAGAGTVAFNIPSAPRTITLSSTLPVAGAGVIIDGTTQQGYAGSPLVEISGANVPSGGSQGCVRTSGAVRGVAVNRCRYADIEGIGAPVITANYIGLDLSGGFAPPNRYGIYLAPGGSGAVIGGSSFADANVITETSVGVYVDSVSNLLVSHNKIGTDASGEPYVGNQYGIVLGNTSNATITSNVIESDVAGVNPVYSSNITIKNNTITGTFGRVMEGIILFQTNTTTIGDIAGGGNTITNANTGVLVLSGTGNAIRGNSIYRMFELGIDLSSGLAADGQTPNDPGDTDSGSNNLQNYPVLTNVIAAAGATAITGTLNSTANQSFTIDFYWDTGLFNGRGQARYFLGTLIVPTDGAGNAAINVTFPSELPNGANVTATATDTEGNTSELTPSAPVNAPAAVPALSGWALLGLVMATAAIAALRL